MKTREWEVTVVPEGQCFGNRETFTFFADNKALAHSHAMQLKYDPGFKFEVLVSDNESEHVRAVAVRFIGWAQI